MNSELESYYHSSSPQRNLDKQIRPIIQQLHESNINSLHQLKLRLQHLPSDHEEDPFSKTLPVFMHPINTISKFYSQKEDKNSKKGRLSATKQKSFTLSPTPKSLQSPRQRIHIISPVSKIKKHLVDHINLDQMREALFKKRNTPNRFEQFCEFIKQKDRSQSFVSKQRSFREGKASMPSEEEFQSIQKNDELSQKFRITTRRKFWRQTRTTLSGDEPSMEMLNIKALVKHSAKS